MRRIVSMLVVVGLVLTASSVLAQVPDSLPEGVTAKMVSDGSTLFSGQGICVACHGPQGKGIPNLGTDLTDAEWTHSDGSYSGILETIRQGVTADKSTSGVAMPPKGGSNLNDDQLKAVAAYVWSLVRAKK